MLCCVVLCCVVHLFTREEVGSRRTGKSNTPVGVGVGVGVGLGVGLGV